MVMGLAIDAKMMIMELIVLINILAVKLFFRNITVWNVMIYLILINAQNALMGLN